MKAWKTTLITAIVLSVLIGLTAFIVLQASAIIVNANVKFDPSKVDLAAPSPKEFKVTLSFSGKYNASNVDRRSILVENLLEPKGGWRHVQIIGNTLVFLVDGPALVDMVIWQKIYHMGIIEPNPNRPYKVPITVTGQFNDGTLFEGTQDMRVLIPSITTPPPPPPA